MMKAPTNSEMPAKASSAVVRKPRLSRMSRDCLAACCSPVRTVTDARQRPPSCALSSSADGPGLRGRLDRVEAPGDAGDALGHGELDVDDRRPAEGLHALDLGEADDLEAAPSASRPGGRSCRRACTPLRSAVCASIATSSGARGRRPCLGDGRAEARVDRLGADEARRARRRPATCPWRRRRRPRSKIAPSADGDRRLALDLVEDRRRQRRRRAAVVRDVLARRDGRVGALVRGDEDLVEGRVDRVGEHVGPGDERHAERDGERGQRQAQLAGQSPRRTTLRMPSPRP